ncbi:MAG: hypothetical protein J1D77_00640 [Muribaculaceae bacterium]|nr:hypothetical protein [Muribaculaceae bacterium]
MKKLALLFCGLGAMFALSLNAENYASPQAEPQYQEQCVPAPCAPDTVCNQVPCNVPVNVPCATPEGVVPCATPEGVVPCATDSVCNPAPCVTPAPAQTQTVNNVCC